MDIAEAKRLITDSLKNNRYCRVGILNDRRVFCSYRKGREELIALLTTFGYPGEEWGHIFYHKGNWISCFVGVVGYLAGKSDSEIIEDYWRNINKRVGWRILNEIEDDQHVRRSNSFEKATKELAAMIKKFDKRYMAFDGMGALALYDVYGIGPFFRKG